MYKTLRWWEPCIVLSGVAFYLLVSGLAGQLGIIELVFSAGMTLTVVVRSIIMLMKERYKRKKGYRIVYDYAEPTLRHMFNENPWFIFPLVLLVLMAAGLALSGTWYILVPYLSWGFGAVVLVVYRRLRFRFAQRRRKREGLE